MMDTNQIEEYFKDAKEEIQSEVLCLIDMTLEDAVQYVREEIEDITYFLAEDEGDIETNYKISHRLDYFKQIVYVSIEYTLAGTLSRESYAFHISLAGFTPAMALALGV